MFHTKLSTHSIRYHAFYCSNAAIYCLIRLPLLAVILKTFVTTKLWDGTPNGFSIKMASHKLTYLNEYFPWWMLCNQGESEWEHVVGPNGIHPCHQHSTPFQNMTPGSKDSEIFEPFSVDLQYNAVTKFQLSSKKWNINFINYLIIGKTTRLGSIEWRAKTSQTKFPLNLLPGRDYFTPKKPMKTMVLFINSIVSPVKHPKQRNFQDEMNERILPITRMR